MLEGKWFHIQPPATRKARRPTVESLTAGIICPSVCLSDTRGYCIKTTRDSITQSLLPVAPELQLLQFCQIRFIQKFDRVHPDRKRLMSEVEKSCNFRP